MVASQASEWSAIAKRSSDPRPGWPWQGVETSGLPGPRNANHPSRPQVEGESSGFSREEEVNSRSSRLNSLPLEHVWTLAGLRYGVGLAPKKSCLYGSHIAPPINWKVRK